jgi:hypothetical protein
MTTPTTVATKRLRVDNHCHTCGGGGLEPCRQCGHTTFCDACGRCNIHGEPKAKRLPTREFLVACEFMPKKGSYAFKGEKVVKAFSLNGAIRKGVYELKKEHVPPRKQLNGVVVRCVPMSAKKGK